MEDSVNRHSVECSGTLPDAAIQARTFGDRLFDYSKEIAEGELEDLLHEKLGGEDKFGFITWDSYDCSLELYGCTSDLAPSDDLVQWIFAQGFGRFWLNHEDQTQTYFTRENPKGHRYAQAAHRKESVEQAVIKRDRNARLSARLAAPVDVTERSTE